MEAREIEPEGVRGGKGVISPNLRVREMLSKCLWVKGSEKLTPHPPFPPSYESRSNTEALRPDWLGFGV